jgi:hypothetical protein
MKVDALSIEPTPTSYQTAPLTEYSSVFLETATDLFQRVCERVKSTRVINPDGSFSVLGGSRKTTAAKLLIYEAGKGKVNGLDPGLVDGVYVLIRTTDKGKSRARTIGVAPWHDIRFAYMRLLPGQDLDEMADFIAACADAM